MSVGHRLVRLVTARHHGSVKCLRAVAVVCGTLVAAGIGSAVTASVAAETGLRRPLHFPVVQAGEPCPRSTGSRPSKKVAIALGPGPAYPVMGLEAAPPAAKGVVALTPDERRGQWYLRKTLWAVAPRERGPILIRAARIDGPGGVRFEAGRPGVLVRELRFPATSSHDWRFGVSSTAVRGPGCYAFQIDGRTFSRVVVFRAVR